MSFLDRFPRSVTHLTRLAALFALLGLATFAFGLFVPKPLPVIFSMSIGHGLGLVAVLLYLVAIFIDTTRKNGATRSSATSMSPPVPHAHPREQLEPNAQSERASEESTREESLDVTTSERRG